MAGQQREARLFAQDVPAIHVFLGDAKQDVDARDIWYEDALRAAARA
jgi:hypothetical protein